jgi:hypothetical protein
MPRLAVDASSHDPRHYSRPSPFQPKSWRCSQRKFRILSCSAPTAHILPLWSKLLRPSESRLAVVQAQARVEKRIRPFIVGHQLVELYVIAGHSHVGAVILRSVDLLSALHPVHRHMPVNRGLAVRSSWRSCWVWAGRKCELRLDVDV